MEAPPRILIADDDPHIAGLIREVLEVAGCEVLEARSGEETLDLLYRENASDRPVDVLLLDILMPGISGYEVISRVKADPLTATTSIIVTTALTSITDKTMGLGMGADDYLTKPFDPRELLARIQVIMRIRRTEQVLRRRNQELALLTEVSRTIIASLDLEEVLKATTEGIQKIFPGATGVLVLMDEETGDMTFRKTIAGDHPLIGRPLPVERSILRHVVATGHPYLTSDAPGDPLFSPQVDGWASPTRAILCVPLLVRERVIGALELAGESENLFTETDRDLLQTLAGSVAVAVENAQLYAEVNDYARALERSQAQLVQAEKMAAIGRLTASIAHEINNPLQAIHNTIHLAMTERLPPEKRREYLGMAQKEVERLIAIVHRMLEFYRPSRGGAVQADVNSLLRDALAIADKRLQHGRVRVSARFADGLPPIPAIPDQLTQVFLNIIINAVEAMPEGGDLRVGTLLTEDRRWILVAFQDSGPGLTAEQIAHLFEPFYTTKPGGTGLGLAISYGIVERHGGTIEVSSQPGQGATFIVRLPAPPP
ncbi:MAG: response regulator [Anaerolineae bacterium]|nr:response regulator [Anaerolineae bacterium]MDW8069641.1 response regulator [Anaerolineae bacterium]